LTNAGVSDVEPASVSVAAPDFTSSGTDSAAWTSDLNLLVQSLVDNGSDLSSASFIMSTTCARYLRTLQTSGNYTFPGARLNGVGEIWGIPQIASSALVTVGSPLENYLLLADCSQIWLAEGPVEIAASNVTALQLDDAPTGSSSTPTATSVISMYQTGTVAVKATMYTNWSVSAATAVATLRGFTL
jgi:hypothetical protein